MGKKERDFKKKKREEYYIKQDKNGYACTV